MCVCVLFAACPFLASTRTMMRASSLVDELSYIPVIRRHKSCKLMTKVGTQNDVCEEWVELISPKSQLPMEKKIKRGKPSGSLASTFMVVVVERRDRISPR